MVLSNRILFLPGDSQLVFDHFLACIWQLAKKSGKNSAGDIRNGSWLNSVDSQLNNPSKLCDLLTLLCEEASGSFVTSLLDFLNNDKKDNIPCKCAFDLVKKCSRECGHSMKKNKTHLTCGGIDFLSGLILALLEEVVGEFILPPTKIHPGHGSYFATKCVKTEDGVKVCQAVLDCIKKLENKLLVAMNCKKLQSGVAVNHNGKETTLWDVDETLC